MCPLSVECDGEVSAECSQEEINDNILNASYNICEFLDFKLELCFYKWGLHCVITQKCTAV